MLSRNHPDRIQITFDDCGVHRRVDGLSIR